MIVTATLTCVNSLSDQSNEHLHILKYHKCKASCLVMLWDDFHTISVVTFLNLSLE